MILTYWGSYHGLSQTEWRQWTEQPQEDARYREWTDKDDSIRYSISSSEDLVIDLDGNTETFTIVSQDETEGYLFWSQSCKYDGCGYFQRLDYAFTAIRKIHSRFVLLN